VRGQPIKFSIADETSNAAKLTKFFRSDAATLRVRLQRSGA